MELCMRLPSTRYWSVVSLDPSHNFGGTFPVCSSRKYVIVKTSTESTAVVLFHALLISSYTIVNNEKWFAIHMQYS